MAVSLVIFQELMRCLRPGTVHRCRSLPRSLASLSPSPLDTAWILISDKYRRDSIQLLTAEALFRLHCTACIIIEKTDFLNLRYCAIFITEDSRSIQVRATLKLRYGITFRSYAQYVSLRLNEFSERTSSIFMSFCKEDWHRAIECILSFVHSAVLSDSAGLDPNQETTYER